jgi:hypothetical protein
VGVEVVFDQHNLRGLGEMCIGQIPEHVSEIHSGVAIGDLNVRRRVL